MGGGTRSRVAYLLDGVETTIADGTFYVSNIIEIEQDTNIISKIDTYSRQIFESDGEIELQVIFDGAINLKTLYVNMSTSLDTYTDVIYPINDVAVADTKLYLPNGCDYVIQKNPSNKQKCITVLNNNKVSSIELPYIKLVAAAYSKLYSTNIQSDDGVAFTNGNFRVIHIFN